MALLRFFALLISSKCSSLDTEFNRDTAFSYCDEVIGSHIIVEGMTIKQKKSLRAIRMLLSYQESGDFEFRTPRVEYSFSGNTGEIILLVPLSSSQI